MDKKTKIWLIIAACFLFVGCIIFGCVMTVLKWDFTKLSTTKYETNHYAITEDIKAISINTDTADIVFVPSENAENAVVCYEYENAKHTVTVEDATLIIDAKDTRKWYEYIGIHFRTPKITVQIAAGAYGALSASTDTGDIEIPKAFRFESIDIAESTGDVTSYASASDFIKIKANTGNIHIEGVSANAIDLSVSTGKITARDVSCEGALNTTVSTGRTELTDIRCNSVISGGSTGNITLNKVVAAEKISLERSTGDVKFDSCDAGEIFVKTDTGDVTGSLLTDKAFIVRTDTGRVDVPKTLTGGRCEISTNTGDIKITTH